MNELVLATDLGGTNLRVAAIDRDGKILYRTKYETPKSERADEIFRAITQAARKCQEAVGKNGKIIAVGAAVPATVNAAAGIILKQFRVGPLHSAGGEQIFGGFQSAAESFEEKNGFGKFLLHAGDDVLPRGERDFVAGVAA